MKGQEHPGRRLHPQARALCSFHRRCWGRVQVGCGPDQRREFRYLVRRSRVFHVKEVVPHQEERNWEAIVVGIAEVTMVVS